MGTARVPAIALVAALLGVSGCATLEIERARATTPPTGPMWAYFTDRELTLGPRALVYTRSQVSCEKERLARNLFSPCVSVMIGPGDDYYAIGLPKEFDAALPDGAIGATSREHCVRYRALNLLQYHNVGDCEPIGVKRAP
jgi:hypothetical protein